MKILIVEDEPITRRALDRILIGLCHHNVVQASTAAEALDILANQTDFDVVLLDINLGDGDRGWPVAAFMQIKPELKNIPLIVVSGMHPEDIREGARIYVNTLSHAALILGKPISKEELLKAIELVTRKSNPP